jgi:hypothetical protein
LLSVGKPEKKTFTGNKEPAEALTHLFQIYGRFSLQIYSYSVSGGTGTDNKAGLIN